MIPQAALEQEREQEGIATVTLASVKRTWRRMLGRNWEQAWRTDVGPNMQVIIREAQGAAAASADRYVASVLTELDLDGSAESALNVDAFVGVAGDGRSVETLTYGAVIESARHGLDPSAPPREAESRALDVGGKWLEGALATILADTARAAETTATTQRPWVTGYVRMIEVGACSRCAILAGKRYRFNDGFLRHPRCRCRHIPASEAIAGDITLDPKAYFDSLPSARGLDERFPDLSVHMRREAGFFSQEDVFTKAGAEAIRMGADVRQVVNARRGMNTAQINPFGSWTPKGRMKAVDVYGNPVFITREGITSRGVAGKRLDNLAKQTGQRYYASKTPRLMPESILAVAKDPEDALRLLKRFGYVL